MQQNIVRQLRSFLDKQDILSTDLWREIYARDASYFDIKPLCVVRPSTMEQIQKVLLHPTCASKLMGTDELMVWVANMCANEAVVPENSFCCGAAGDRGFIFPEVAKSATAPERESIGNVEYDGCYSLARTCEISMMDTIQRPYESIIYLVDETTE